MESQWKLNQKHDDERINEGKAIVEQILASEKRNKYKRLWETQSGIQVEKLANWVMSFQEIITEFTKLIISTRIGKPVLTMNVKFSKNKNISSWVDG